MGISEGREAGKGIDCSVGTIVWVRRRNGSWWPGRILGSNELSSSHLMSPRSGTPVKLLGREDASVDWYNLEKSKRVKAFRCGEFDDCIRRAESSQGMPPKKREKYARREDAIIHALELEKQQCERRRQKLGINSNCLSNIMLGTSNRELGSCSPSEDFSGNYNGRDHCRYINLKSQTLSKKPDSSLEDGSMCDLFYVQRGKHRKTTWEDDISEATPRMRGLQDFGLRTATSKQKLSTSIASRGSRKPFLVDEPYILPTAGHNIGTLNNVRSIKNKRSLGGVAEESLTRRRDRRRRLVQVLQSSSKSPVCQSLESNGDTMSITTQGDKEQVGALCQAKRGKHVYLPVESNYCLDHKGFPSEQMQMSPLHFEMDNSLIHPGSLTEEYTSSGLIEGQESDSSEGDYLDDDTEEDEALFSGPANSGRYISCGGSIYQVPMQTGNMDNEGLDESELSSYVSQLHPHEQTAGVASDMGGSKWQLKGKRNIRNLTKKPMELIDGKDPIIIPNKCNVSIHKSLCQGKGNIIKTTGINSRRTLGWQGLHHRGKELSYTYEEGDLIEKDFQQTQMVGFGRRYPSILKASSGDRGRSNNSFISSDEDSHVISSSIWEADHQSQEALRGYWEESDGCFDPVYVGRLGDQMESMLLDVDLKVQASYQGERVPLVSLMSKLNGKAIVGHPVQVEILEDGYSDLLPRDDFCGHLPDTDGNAALPQVWRTARRTAMHRVPRPPSSAVEGEEASTLQYSDLESKRPFKKQYTGHVKHKVRMMKGRFSHIRGPRAHKFPKKLLKKATMSSQKTRTLSSIAIEQKPVGKNTITIVSDKNVELHGLIKHERAPMVMVTCVPVKLVFSRIREAIGRPPSAAANHGVLTAGSAERKPPL